MAALPYIQLYVADYLADTIHLSAEEHGAYLLIIMNYWQTGKPIPENRLQAISRIPNERWTDVKQTLSCFFTPNDGEWIHSRIEEDLQKVLSKSIKCSKAGKKSALAKALKNKEETTDVKQTHQRTFNHTDTNTNKDTDIKIKTTVEKKDSRLAVVEEIFSFWQTELNHKKAKLDDKRKKVIRDALKLGYGVDDLKKAITGCKLTPFNMGDNDRGETYDRITLILANADNIDRFIKNFDNPPTVKSKSNKRLNNNISAAKDFMEKTSG